MQQTEQQAIQALQNGQPQLAEAFFQQRTTTDPTNVSAWLGLAVSKQLQGKYEECINAVDEAIQREPVNLSALILKGDVLLHMDMQRDAMQCYAMAIGIAGQSPDLPQDLQVAIQRIQHTYDQLSANVEKHLHEALEASGYKPDQDNARFTHALSLLSGAKHRFTQQPRAFFFPELPTIQFYPRNDFDWVTKVEAATADIVEEFKGILAKRAGFEPYIRSDEQGPTANINRNLDSMDWSAFFLIKNGRVIEEHVAQCPKTMAALADVPQPDTRGRSPMVLFSLLKPGARIEPHCGFLNTRLVCHLPLVVPHDCGLRVGNEVRTWKKGELTIFNDSIEHEAWNSSQQLRAVLIFDIWRPELTSTEKRLVNTLLESVDKFDAFH